MTTRHGTENQDAQMDKALHCHETAHSTQYDVEKFLLLIADKWFGPKPIFLTEVDSTNTYLKKLWKQGYPPGTTVIADCQTGGKGRMGRRWFSPPGMGIWLSVLFPSIDRQNWAAVLMYMAALSVLEAVDRFIGESGQIKWPNDILVNGKKLCGMLAEGVMRNGKSDNIIMGIGINVNHQPADFPEEIFETATSLKMINGHTHSREEFLVSLLENINSYFALAMENGGGIILERWKKRCGTIGKSVSLGANSSQIYGVAESVSPAGTLLIRTAEGKLMEVTAADGVHQLW